MARRWASTTTAPARATDTAARFAATAIVGRAVADASRPYIRPTPLRDGDSGSGQTRKPSGANPSSAMPQPRAGKTRSFLAHAMANRQGPRGPQFGRGQGRGAVGRRRGHLARRLTDCSCRPQAYLVVELGPTARATRPASTTCALQHNDSWWPRQRIPATKRDQRPPAPPRPCVAWRLRRRQGCRASQWSLPQ